MGIIRAIGQAIGGGFADQWLEVIEAADMGDDTVFCEGVKIRKGENVKGSDGTVTNGSVIHVYSNQFMLLVDGGKVVDYTAEEGYYKVDNTAMPSLFNGEFDKVLEESFERIKFGGQTSQKQKVFFINLQEIKGLRFGTRNPVNYFDNFYNAELFLRAHGNYSIKITDPIRFYAEAVPKNRSIVRMNDINEQYLSEFLEALQSAIGQMSVDGIRISHIQAKGRELGKYMADILDEELSEEYRESVLGNIEEVLLEEEIDIDGMRYMIGHTKTYIKVVVPMSEELRSNMIISCKMDKIMDGGLILGLN